MSDKQIPGGCFCGAIRYTLMSPPRDLCLCHCQSCRRASGAPFVAWGTVNRGDFRLAQGELVIHNSSPGVERGHCAQCGSTITYFDHSREKELDVALATLDDPEQFPARVEIFTEERLHWLQAQHGLQQYATLPSREDKHS